MNTNGTKSQLQLNIRVSRQYRRGRAVSRNRAQWWFARMKEVVTRANEGAELQNNLTLSM